MKRIIDGKTYNTDTATCLAAGGPTDPSDLAGWEIYQTRHGAFFKVVADHDGKPTLTPIADTEAYAFLEKHANHTLETAFGPYPEAGAAERRLTIRVPGSLADRIEAAAVAKGLSLNSYVTRCFEQCAIADGQPPERA